MTSQYVPDRNHVIWLDFEPSREREIGKYRPAFVLSSRTYNEQTGLLICCPVTSSIRGARTEVKLEGLSKPSVIAASVVQTYAWKSRKAKYIKDAEPGILESVLHRLLPLLGAQEAG